jgi:hypothetical protein
MRLLNFDLERDVGAITLRGQGHDWDLHNCAHFEGFRCNGREDTLLLRWVSIMDAKRGCTMPWGDATNHARSCGLLFRGLRTLHLDAKNEPIKEFGDPTGLSGLSRTVPGKGQLGFRSEWRAGEDYHLFFEFDDGRSLEIGAGTVELVVNPPEIF